MVVLIAFITSLLIFPLVLAQNPCLVPTPRTDNDWMDQHQELLDAVAQDTSNGVVWIGDSIIAIMIWSTLWQTKISTLGSINLGIGGDRVENILWRIENGEFDFNIPIKAVVIFVGTNNIYDNTPEDIAEGIINLVTVSKQKLGQDTSIILPTLLPRGEYPNQERTNLTTINRLLLQRYPVNPTENVYVVQIGQDAIQPDGTLSIDDFYDFLHPSDQGFTKFFTAVYDQLVQILS